jgi:hypothetical protein
MLGFNPLDSDSPSLLLAASAVTSPTSSDTNGAINVGVPVDASGETAVSVAVESHLHEQKQVIENIKVSLSPYFVLYIYIYIYILLSLLYSFISFLFFIFVLARFCVIGNKLFAAAIRGAQPADGCMGVAGSGSPGRRCR